MNYYFELLQSYYTQFLNFWQVSGKIVAYIACGVLVLFLLINLLRNDYRAINGKVRHSCGMLSKLVSNGNQAKFIKSIPQPYLGQYKCYMYTNGLKANDVMTFVPVKQKTVGIFWAVVALLVLAYDAYFGISKQYHYSYFYANGGAVLFVVIAIFAITACHRHNAKHARRVVGRYFDMLSAVKGNSNGQSVEPFVEEQKVDNAVKAIKVMSDCPDQDQSMTRVTELLRDKALKGERTVKQQRKINRALNELMLKLARRRQVFNANAVKANSRPIMQSTMNSANNNKTVGQIINFPTPTAKVEQPAL